ncbi:MAG: hypothetical protein NVS2B8_20500 [Vulcanimicrobiaceae bacterium]
MLAGHEKSPAPPEANASEVYPIALDLREKLVVVVGGGTIADRKVRGLLAVGARVRVVAPEVTDGIREAAAAGAIELRERPYAPGDLHEARLAYTATGVADVDRAVVAEARALGIFVDDTTGAIDSDFSTPLAHRVGPLTFAVDTGGSSPAFARRLLDDLRARYDARYGRAAESLACARDYVKAVVPVEHRAAVMRDLSAREIDALAAMNPGTVENDVEETYARIATPDKPVEPFLQLVCATRASALAMWQTRYVMAEFGKAGFVSTVMQISTKGDRVLDRSLAALGTDSIFVKELENALRDKRADYAVHSCKDLPSTLPEDMTLAAIGTRVDPRDAFCSEKYASLDALPPGALVGTSSPRRRAQLQAMRPDLRFAIVRGNVDTRLRKLRDGEYDAILLAMAGLTRLGLGATHTVPIPVDVLVPAVGQGALAIEVRASDVDLAARIAHVFTNPIDDIAVRAERAFLRTLRGGCRAPFGAHATYDDGTLAMRAIIAAIDGSHVVRGETAERVASVAEAERAGEGLAHRLLAQGGDALLADALAEAVPPAPLAGHLFLLPRTQDRPSSISPALRSAGAEVVEAIDSDAALAALGERTPSALLFPSSGSVKAVAPYLARLRASGSRPIVAAMGEASSLAARDAGFPPDVVATEPSIGAFVHSVTHFLIGVAR